MSDLLGVHGVLATDGLFCVVQVVEMMTEGYIHKASALTGGASPEPAVRIALKAIGMFEKVSSRIKDFTKCKEHEAGKEQL